MRKKKYSAKPTFYAAILVCALISTSSIIMTCNHDDPKVTVESTTESSVSEDKPVWESRYTLSNSEYDLLTHIVEVEAGGESHECKEAVVSVIMNQMTSEHKTLSEVLYADGQFEGMAYISEVIPSSDTVSAVDYVLHYGSTLPEYVTYFRADEFHTWGDQKPYAVISNTYFSYSASAKQAML